MNTKRTITPTGLMRELKKKGMNLHQFSKTTDINYSYLNLLKNGKRQITPKMSERIREGLS